MKVRHACVQHAGHGHCDDLAFFMFALAFVFAFEGCCTHQELLWESLMGLVLCFDGSSGCDVTRDLAKKQESLIFSR